MNPGRSLYNEVYTYRIINNKNVSFIYSQIIGYLYIGLYILHFSRNVVEMYQQSYKQTHCIWYLYLSIAPVANIVEYCIIYYILICCIYYILEYYIILSSFPNERMLCREVQCRCALWILFLKPFRISIWHISGVA